MPIEKKVSSESGVEATFHAISYVAFRPAPDLELSGKFEAYVTREAAERQAAPVEGMRYTINLTTVPPPVLKAMATIVGYIEQQAVAPPPSPPPPPVDPDDLHQHARDLKKHAAMVAGRLLSGGKVS